MGPISEAVLAFLSAAGLLALAHWIMDALLLTARGGSVCAVLPVSGGAETLEHDLKALRRLRRRTGRPLPLILADTGLSGEGLRTVRALMAEYGGVALCPADRLGDYLGSYLNDTIKG